MEKFSLDAFQQNSFFCLAREKTNLWRKLSNRYDRKESVSVRKRERERQSERKREKECVCVREEDINSTKLSYEWLMGEQAWKWFETSFLQVSECLKELNWLGRAEALSANDKFSSFAATSRTVNNTRVTWHNGFLNQLQAAWIGTCRVTAIELSVKLQTYSGQQTNKFVGGLSFVHS